MRESFAACKPATSSQFTFGLSITMAEPKFFLSLAFSASESSPPPSFPFWDSDLFAMPMA